MKNYSGQILIISAVFNSSQFATNSVNHLRFIAKDSKHLSICSWQQKKPQKSSNIDRQMREKFLYFLQNPHTHAQHTHNPSQNVHFALQKNSSPFFFFLYSTLIKKSPAVGKKKYFTVIVVDVVVRVCNIVHINGVSLESAAAMAKKKKEE